MALTKDEREKLDETRDIVRELRTILVGAEGEENGLCATVKRLASSHYKLRLSFWVLVAFLIGSGIIASSVLGIIK